MNPRYFVGVSLPDEITDEIQAIQKQYLDETNVMKALVPHITLIHPSVLMSLSPMYFVPRVKQIATAKLPFTIKLTGIETFDNRVLYVSVSCPGLFDLQQKLVEILPDDIKAQYLIGRTYTPHITIAQAKPLQKLSHKLIDTLTLEIDKIIPKSFKCKNLQQFIQVKPRTYSIKDI